MTTPTLLIPDAGPLFSLAAAQLLDTLLNFNLAITDIVKQETIDKGNHEHASLEAKRLFEFYEANKAVIEIYETQVGHDVQHMRASQPGMPLPPNSGELSIQSLLIHLRITASTDALPIVLFEDGWFIRNRASIENQCVAISTEAFLINLEQLGILPSAQEARRAIDQLRPNAYKAATKLDRF